MWQKYFTFTTSWIHVVLCTCVCTIYMSCIYLLILQQNVKITTTTKGINANENLNRSRLVLLMFCLWKDIALNNNCGCCFNVHRHGNGIWLLIAWMSFQMQTRELNPILKLFIFHIQQEKVEDTKYNISK
jgi:hypothetical protein